MKVSVSSSVSVDRSTFALCFSALTDVHRFRPSVGNTAVAVPSIAVEI